MTMADADLTAVAPTGRLVEELAKVGPKYRVAAWKCALKAFKQFRQSTIIGHIVLWNFCFAKKIDFGTIKPDHFKVFERYVVQSAGKRKAKQKTPGKKSEDSADWIDHLSEAELRIFDGILQHISSKKVMSQPDGKTSVTIIDTLRKVASDDCNDQAADRMEAVFAVLGEKEPLMVAKLYRWMLCQLSDVISQKVELQFTENQSTGSEGSEAA